MNPIRRGGRAVPSMGLSQYRGGMESDSDEESVGGQMRRMVGEGFFQDLYSGAKDAAMGVAQQVAADPIGSFQKAKAGYDTAQKFLGKGTKKGQVRKTARRAYEPMEEATAMGLHLGKHLHGLHGDDFLQKFGAGMVGAAVMCEGRGAGMSGGNFFDDLKHAFSPEVWDPQKNGVAQAFEDFGQKTKHEFVDPNSMLRGEILPTAAKVATAVSAIPGVGEVLAPVTGAISLAEKANQGAKMLGLGRKGRGKLVITHGGASISRTGRYEGEGKTEHYAKLGMVGEGFFDTLKDLGQRGLEEIRKDPVAAAQKVKGAYEMGKQFLGKGGKKRRAPAGPHDGRRKRAEIVRKVMSEKGLSMIAASKYVKEHGLY